MEIARFELQARCNEVLVHLLKERRREAGIGVVGRVVQMRPGERTRDVNGGVLPHAPFRPTQPPHAEAIELNEVSGLPGDNVTLLLLLALRRRWDGSAGNQAEALAPRGESMAAEDAPDAVGRDHHSAPALLGQLGSDPLRSEAWVAKGEGHHPVLRPRRHLIRHPR